MVLTMVLSDKQSFDFTHFGVKSRVYIDRARSSYEAAHETKSRPAVPSCHGRRRPLNTQPN